MWMGERLNRRDESQITAADMGRTTISGETVAVESRGELRELEVWRPGGYLWRPRQGDEVLVIRGGTAGEERCVVAMAAEDAPEEIEAGEVCLYSAGGARALLRNDGTVLLKSGDGLLRLKGGQAELHAASIKLMGSVAVEGSLSINGVGCCGGKCGEA